MFWFKKRHNEEQRVEERKLEAEIVAHKKNIKKQVTKVNKAANKVTNVFEENGFTAKIFVAVGGKDPKQKKGTYQHGH